MIFFSSREIYDWEISSFCATSFCVNGSSPQSPKRIYIISRSRRFRRGAKVRATATLTAVDGRKLTFAVEAADEAGAIGKGTHVRFIVDKERFMAKLG